jgi:hypothetical protein
MEWNRKYTIKHKRYENYFLGGKQKSDKFKRKD